MTLYSSGKHTKRTEDEWPWLCERDGCRARRQTWHTGTYAPRASFDRPLANPANRILAYVRAHLDGRHDRRTGIAWWAADRVRLRRWLDPADPPYTPEEEAHALAVLTRIPLAFPAGPAAPGPEQRIRDFVEAWETHRDSDEIADVTRTGVRAALTLSDLRDLLAEVESYRSDEA